MRIGVIGSGASLALDDVKKLHEQCDFLVAVNQSYIIAPDLFKYVFAGDFSFWSKRHDQIPRHIGKITSCFKSSDHYMGVMYMNGFLRGIFGSGGRAIECAYMLGATEIFLLGMDCQIDNGIHWHGEYQDLRNPTHASVRAWSKHFEMVSNKLAGKVEIVNYSRKTSLNCFKRGTL